jgi:hypothetical protein
MCRLLSWIRDLMPREHSRVARAWQGRERGRCRHEARIVPGLIDVSGGTARAASIDVRFVVRAESPHGTIRVFLDDPDLPPRQVPNRMMLQAVLREGQVMQGPWGRPVLLSRYLTGEQFARRRNFLRELPARRGAGNRPAERSAGNPHATFVRGTEASS